MTGKTVISMALWLMVMLIAPMAVANGQGKDPHGGPAMNFHVIDARLATGGHFVGDGIAAIRDRGVTIVIDLRDKPPEGQGEKLADAGIEWINIPVVWSDPQVKDFEEFAEAMSTHADDNVLVQCQANYRASAMTYLYRVTVDSVPEEQAKADLNAVWEPEGRWQNYIEEILAAD